MNWSTNRRCAFGASPLAAALWRCAETAAPWSASLGALFFALFATTSIWAAEPWPEIPMPPKATVQWVGDSMRVNGVPMRVMQFHSQAGRAEVVEYYRAHWSGAYPTRPSMTTLAGATVVSQKHGPYLMTAKVGDAADGASKGLVAVSRVVGSKVEFNAGDLPLMPGAKVVSVVESNDPGKRSREVVVVSPQAPQAVVQFFQASYEGAGWHQVQNNDAPRTATSSAGTFIVFARDRDEVQLSVTELPNANGSALVANRLTRDVGPEPF